MALEFKKPDLSAPRYRISRLLLLNKKLHERFIKKFPEHAELSCDDFKNIIKTFNTNIWQTTITNRDGVELPEGLGYSFIGTCPSPKKFNTDPIASGKYGVKITHRNFESDNFLAKIFYTNFASRYKFKDREVWRFIGHRNFKRAVAKAYPENWKMYIQVDNFQRIHHLFNKYFKKVIAIKLSKPVTDEYNEFAL